MALLRWGGRGALPDRPTDPLKPHNHNHCGWRVVFDHGAALYYL
jgi:hypothetical protein